MYAWSICTRLHGTTSLDHECKVFVENFLNSIHFLHLFRYSLTSCEYPGHHASNVILFCVAATPVNIIVYTFYYQFSLVFLGKLSGHHYKSLHVLSLTYVLFLCWVFLPWSNFSIRFFLVLDVILLSAGSCLVSAAILSKDKTSVSTQCKKCILKFFCFIFWLLVKSQSW